MSHPVIHKIDIGKVKTSKNVMKLLKLLLTVYCETPCRNISVKKEMSNKEQIRRWSASLTTLVLFGFGIGVEIGFYQSSD